jgi:hypothetical protein
MGNNTAYETSVTNSVTSMCRLESDRGGLYSAVSRERKVRKDYVGINKADPQTITTQIHSLSISRRTDYVETKIHALRTYTEG